MQILLQVAYKKIKYNPSKCKSTFIYLIEPFVILTTKNSMVNHVKILVLSPRKCDRNLNCIEIGWEKNAISSASDFNCFGNWMQNKVLCLL